MDPLPPASEQSTQKREQRSKLNVTFHGPGATLEPWYAVASSRLGKPVEKRRQWFQLLHRVVQQAVADRAALLIVPGTTAGSWLERAAQFYDCPIVSVAPDDSALPLENPDQLLVELADRLFVLRCRRGGLVSKLVRQRLPEKGAETFVAIWSDPDDAGHELLDLGAVGWWLYEANDCAEQAKLDQPVTTDCPQMLNQLPEIPGGWLIHCTRARSGPLPGQTETQWRDEVLLGGEGGKELTALDVLVRIVKQQRVRAVQQAKDQPPVVCLSQVDLGQLLSRRTFRQHRGRWDYEPFGLAFSREKLEALGARPVVYAQSWKAAELPTDEKWRFQAVGKTFDWTAECEWRLPESIDLSNFADDQLVLFVGDQLSAYQIADFTRWPVIIAPVNV